MIEPLPPGPFDCIVCDVPWGFLTYAKAQALPQRAPTQHYDTMTIDQVKALPVASVAAPDCLLHMWVISSHLPQAFEIAAAWGFEFRSIGLVWVKTQKGNFQPRMGMGYWFRQEAEISLVFGRGKPKRLSKGVHQVIQEPAREHSRKPDVAMARIAALSGTRRLEMFARSTRTGFQAWGIERTKFDTETTQGSPDAIQCTTPAKVDPAAAG